MAARQHVGMADHVHVGKMQHDQVMDLRLNVSSGFLGDLPRAHFRLKIIGRHTAGRRNQAVVFAGERFLLAAVEKIGDMGVFFRLGDAQLL